MLKILYLILKAMDYIKKDKKIRNIIIKKLILYISLKVKAKEVLIYCMNMIIIMHYLFIKLKHKKNLIVQKF